MRGKRKQRRPFKAKRRILKAPCGAWLGFLLTVEPMGGYPKPAKTKRKRN